MTLPAIIQKGNTESTLPFFAHWSKDLAYVVCIGDYRKRVTWSDLKTERVYRQRKHLDWMLTPEPPRRRAAFLWSFYVPGFIYGGWHLYLRTLADSYWISRDFNRQPDCPYDQLILKVMAEFPCGLLPIRENFDKWLSAFAEEYRATRKRCRKPQGIVYGWAIFDISGQLSDFEACA